MAASFSVPSMMEEEGRFEAEVAEVQTWWSSERFKLTKRPYTARDVVALRGHLKQSYASNEMARKLWRTLKSHQANGTASRTFGALDPVQVTMMAKHLDTIYVSGWQCSSTHTSTNEPGPDLADYPYDTVPNTRSNISSLLSSTMTELKARTNTSNTQSGILLSSRPSLLGLNVLLLSQKYGDTLRTDKKRASAGTTRPVQHIKIPMAKAGNTDEADSPPRATCKDEAIFHHSSQNSSNRLTVTWKRWNRRFSGESNGQFRTSISTLKENRRRGRQRKKKKVMDGGPQAPARDQAGEGLSKLLRGLDLPLSFQTVSLLDQSYWL
ncbi:unnamed protein product [Brassica oleracea]